MSACLIRFYQYIDFNDYFTDSSQTATVSIRVLAPVAQIPFGWTTWLARVVRLQSTDVRTMPSAYTTVAMTKMPGADAAIIIRCVIPILVAVSRF